MHYKDKIHKKQKGQMILMAGPRGMLSPTKTTYGLMTKLWGAPNSRLMKCTFAQLIFFSEFFYSKAAYLGIVSLYLQMSPWDLVMIILSLNLNLITSLYTTYNLHIKVKSALPGGGRAVGGILIPHLQK